MSTDRREFLQRLTLGSVAFGSFPSLPPPSLTLRARRTFGEWKSCRSNRRAGVRSVDAEATGKYKTVFDMPEINGGGGVWRAGLWSNHCRDVLKTEPTRVSVIVLRHAASRSP